LNRSLAIHDLNNLVFEKRQRKTPEQIHVSLMPIPVPRPTHKPKPSPKP
jgi:hypothetical protein